MQEGIWITNVYKSIWGGATTSRQERTHFEAKSLTFDGSGIAGVLILKQLLAFLEFQPHAQ
jgi:hypothetical protein